MSDDILTKTLATIKRVEARRATRADVASENHADRSDWSDASRGAATAIRKGGPPAASAKAMSASRNQNAKASIPAHTSAAIAHTAAGNPKMAAAHTASVAAENASQAATGGSAFAHSAAAAAHQTASVAHANAGHQAGAKYHADEAAFHMKKAGRADEWSDAARAAAAEARKGGGKNKRGASMEASIAAAKARAASGSPSPGGSTNKNRKPGEKVYVAGHGNTTVSHIEGEHVHVHATIDPSGRPAAPGATIKIHHSNVHDPKAYVPHPSGGLGHGSTPSGVDDHGHSIGRRK